MKLEIPPFFNGKNLFVQCIFLLLFILGGASIFSAFGALTGLAFFSADSTGFLRWTQFWGSLGGFFVPALLFSYCYNKQWFSYNFGNQTAPHNFFFIITILSIFIIPAVSLLGYWNGLMELPEALAGIERWMQEMEEENGAIIEQLMGDSRISIFFANLIVMALVPALGEEFLFRGTIQPICKRIFKNDHTAIWITAFIFSAIHLQFYGFIPRLLLGAYLGYLLYWSRSIWVPVCAHFLHNGITTAVVFVSNRKGINIDESNPMDMPGSLPIMIISFIVITIGIYFLWKNRVLEKKNSSEIDHCYSNH